MPFCYSTAHLTNFSHEPDQKVDNLLAIYCLFSDLGYNM